MFKVGDKVKVNALRYKGFIGEIIALEKNDEGFDWATVAIPVYYTAKHKDTVIYKYLSCALTKVDDTKKIGGKKVMFGNPINSSRGFEPIEDAFRKYPQCEPKMPTRSDMKSAGYDFYLPCDVTLRPKECLLVFTDIKAYMQQDEVLTLHIRSSIGVKLGVVLANCTGIIDASYYGNADNDGNIGLPLLNTTNKVVELKKGERIAQGMFTKYLVADNEEVLNAVRNGGFGSSGKINYGRVYMKIENVQVNGLENALRVAGFPMAEIVEKADNVPQERREKVAHHLAKSNGAEGHDQFLTGITVTFDVTGTIQWWQEAERYRFLYFISSQSKMHRAHKMGIKACCNKYVDDEIIEICEKYQWIYQKALELEKHGGVDKDYVKKCFYRMIYNIPSGFQYTAGMVTNYRQLKTIYNQRRTHRLQEWQDFCDWIETLPMSELIIGNYQKNKEGK